MFVDRSLGIALSFIGFHDTNITSESLRFVGVVAVLIDIDRELAALSFDSTAVLVADFEVGG